MDYWNNGSDFDFDHFDDLFNLPCPTREEGKIITNLLK